MRVRGEDDGSIHVGLKAWMIQSMSPMMHAKNTELRLLIGQRMEEHTVLRPPHTHQSAYSAPYEFKALFFKRMRGAKKC